MVASLLLPKIREQTSMAAIVKRWPGPIVSVLTLFTVAAESEGIVYLWPLSCRRSRMQSAR